ncbi:MAG: 30S ribosomal protein S16 [Chloroflexi bacterium]|nr:30S ribosomal protein S16 [Chloroflexota bacterium]
MVRIRLRRLGAKGHPAYRVVVTDQRAMRDGAFIEQVGTYDPMTDPPTIKIDEELTLKWLRQGAQPSDAVGGMLKKLGILDKVKEPA